NRGVGGVEDAEFLKGDLNRKGELPCFAFVDLRRGVEDDEEGEEKRDEVGVRNEPTLVVDVLFGLAATAHAEAGRDSREVVWCVCEKKARSLVSIMRGFMPSRMEMTPSSIISRRTCSWRTRSFIFPATGRKKRLAAPTP